MSEGNVKQHAKGRLTSADSLLDAVSSSPGMATDVKGKIDEKMRPASPFRRGVLPPCSYGSTANVFFPAAEGEKPMAKHCKLLTRDAKPTG